MVSDTANRLTGRCSRPPTYPPIFHFNSKHTLEEISVPRALGNTVFIGKSIMEKTVHIWMLTGCFQAVMAHCPLLLSSYPNFPSIGTAPGFTQQKKELTSECSMMNFVYTFIDLFSRNLTIRPVLLQIKLNPGKAIRI